MGDGALVIGGGVIGLSIAWLSSLRGVDTVVVDPKPLGGASWVAAGMLGAAAEAAYQEEELAVLNRTSVEMYPAFAERLAAATGVDVGYRPTGSLVVAFDASDLAALREMAKFQRRLGLPVEELTAAGCRSYEPLLSPRISGGFLAPLDHHVDNRLLSTALLQAAEAAGATVVRRTVERLASEPGPGGEPARITGVVLDDQTVLAADQVVLAAGAWSSSIGGLPPADVPPVRPVKGQTCRLLWPGAPGRAGGARLGRPVRALVRGRPAYVVPRDSGEVVVGVTVEEQGYDVSVTAGGVAAVLEDCLDLVPALEEAKLVEVLAGLRPTTPDNAPIIGPGQTPGLVLATGHYRHGIALAPATAEAISSLLAGDGSLLAGDGSVPAGGKMPGYARPFSPGRFAART